MGGGAARRGFLAPSTVPFTAPAGDAGSVAPAVAWRGGGKTEVLAGCVRRAGHAVVRWLDAQSGGHAGQAQRSGGGRRAELRRRIRERLQAAGVSFLANDNIAVVVNQQKIACLHVAEALSERVHPEVIRQDWVTGGHVPGDAFAKSKASKDPQCASEFCFAVSALFFEVVEGLGMECDDRLVSDGHIRTIVTNSHSI